MIESIPVQDAHLEQETPVKPAGDESSHPRCDSTVGVFYDCPRPGYLAIRRIPPPGRSEFSPVYQKHVYCRECVKGRLNLWRRLFPGERVRITLLFEERACAVLDDLATGADVVTYERDGGIIHLGAHQSSE